MAADSNGLRGALDLLRSRVDTVSDRAKKATSAPPNAPASPPARPLHRFVDIGANLTDPMFTGLYRGKQAHPSDLNAVLNRSWAAGLEKIIVTGGSLSDAAEALALAREDDRLYLTVGCHPTRCTEFRDGGDGYYTGLLELASAGRGKVVAIGECGLDYARLQFCPREVQLQYFERQFDLAEATGLPMFLHLREAEPGDPAAAGSSAVTDFVEVYARNRHRVRGGVVHSFDGTAEAAAELVALGLSIGINGCSLRTAANLEVVAGIPVDRLLLETDAPWCGIKPSHAGSMHVRTKPATVKKDKFAPGYCVKDRSEPLHIQQVLEVLAAARGIEEALLAASCFANTTTLFFPE